MSGEAADQVRVQGGTSAEWRKTAANEDGSEESEVALRPYRTRSGARRTGDVLPLVERRRGRTGRRLV